MLTHDEKDELHAVRPLTHVYFRGIKERQEYTQDRLLSLFVIIRRKMTWTKRILQGTSEHAKGSAKTLLAEVQNPHTQLRQIPKHISLPKQPQNGKSQAVS